MCPPSRTFSFYLSLRRPRQRLIETKTTRQQRRNRERWYHPGGIEELRQEPCQPRQTRATAEQEKASFWMLRSLLQEQPPPVYETQRIPSLCMANEMRLEMFSNLFKGQKNMIQHSTNLQCTRQWPSTHEKNKWVTLHSPAKLMPTGL